jgi:hypothetical protein
MLRYNVIIICCSGFLFLLVALEGAQAKDSSFHLEKNETYETYKNVTLSYENHENFESSVVLSTETQAAVTFKTSQDDRYYQVNE